MITLRVIYGLVAPVRWGEFLDGRDLAAFREGDCGYATNLWDATLEAAEKRFSEVSP